MGESQAPAGGWRRTAAALAACAAFALAVRALYRWECAFEACPTQARIVRLVKQLGAPAWRDRQRASRELAELMPAARLALEQAVGSPNLEVAARARELLSRRNNTGPALALETYVGGMEFYDLDGGEEATPQPPMEEVLWEAATALGLDVFLSDRRAR